MVVQSEHAFSLILAISSTFAKLGECGFSFSDIKSICPTHIYLEKLVGCIQQEFHFKAKQAPLFKQREGGKCHKCLKKEHFSLWKHWGLCFHNSKCWQADTNSSYSQFNLLTADLTWRWSGTCLKGQSSPETVIHRSFSRDLLQKAVIHLNCSYSEALSHRNTAENSASSCAKRLPSKGSKYLWCTCSCYCDEAAPPQINTYLWVSVESLLNHS